MFYMQGLVHCILELEETESISRYVETYHLSLMPLLYGERHKKVNNCKDLTTHLVLGGHSRNNIFIIHMKILKYYILGDSN